MAVNLRSKKCKLKALARLLHTRYVKKTEKFDNITY